MIARYFIIFQNGHYQKGLQHCLGQVLKFHMTGYHLFVWQRDIMHLQCYHVGGKAYNISYHGL